MRHEYVRREGGKEGVSEIRDKFKGKRVGLKLEDKFGGSGISAKKEGSVG